MLDVFHGLTVTSWAVNRRHAAPILTTKLDRANHHINDRFIDQHLFTTDPTAVEIFLWRGPKGAALSTSLLLDELPEHRPMTVILVSGAWR